jgi:hypothetical protein
MKEQSTTLLARALSIRFTAARYSEDKKIHFSLAIDASNNLITGESGEDDEQESFLFGKDETRNEKCEEMEEIPFPLELDLAFYFRKRLRQRASESLPHPLTLFHQYTTHTHTHRATLTHQTAIKYL